MKLMLDHTQRLNLHALLGAQRADVGSIRAIWSIQDRIALHADEEKALELKREIVAGQERVVWNPACSISTRQFDFTETEISRMKAAIHIWDSFAVSGDRLWLEPLLHSLLQGPEIPTKCAPPTSDVLASGVAKG